MIFHWLLPLFLIVASLGCLFRLVSLTTHYEGVRGTQLPHKLLNGLGLRRQKEREEILDRICLYPLILLWFFLGLAYLGLKLYFFIEQSGMQASQHYWQAVGNGYSPFLFLKATQVILFPFLCGLVFMWALSMSYMHRFAQKLALVSVMLMAVFFTAALLQERGASAYILRIESGQFTLSVLPMMCGLSILIIAGHIILDGFKEFYLPAALCLIVGFGLFALDFAVPLSSAAQMANLCGWVALGALTGPGLYHTQKSYAFYSRLKAQLQHNT